MKSPLRSDQYSLIDLRRDAPRGMWSPVLNLLAPVIERCLGFQHVNEVYRGVQREFPRDRNFFSACARSMELEIQMNASRLKEIPRTGGLLVVSNHPLGAVDAIALGHMLAGVRPDLKVMANSMLCKMPETADQVIAVNPFGGCSASRENVHSMRQALEWVKDGGALLVFPAGEVSHYRTSKNRVTDPVWNSHVGHLARRAGCPVVPVFVEGRNSIFFQAAGMLHPRLRTLLLAREVARAQCLGVRLLIGKMLSPSLWRHFPDATTLTRFFRSVTYSLAATRQTVITASASTLKKELPAVERRRDEYRAELEDSGKGAVLAGRGHWEVRLFTGREAPGVLQELGRLRELTFRAVGEGTGKPSDLDSFDAYYRHLVLWNRENGKITGAYRLGLVDEILPQYGMEGLYTASLFKLKSAFFRRFGPAIECGRSFVVQEHQKSFGLLALLWQGIGAFVARNPIYTHLFGPVSISGDYQPVSRNLMLHYCRRRVFDRRGARWVRANNPPRASERKSCGFREMSSLLNTIEEVGGMVSYLEHDNKGIPVLLRHYLKLNAKLLSFNIDEDFSDALDGLMVVDLRTAPKSLLSRFMGKDQAAMYLAHTQKRRLPFFVPAGSN